MAKSKDAIKTDVNCREYFLAHCRLTINEEHHTRLARSCEIGAPYCQRKRKEIREAWNEGGAAREINAPRLIKVEGFVTSLGNADPGSKKRPVPGG